MLQYSGWKHLQTQTDIMQKFSCTSCTVYIHTEPLHTQQFYTIYVATDSHFP